MSELEKGPCPDPKPRTLAKYGLSLQEWHGISANQEGRCAVCERPFQGHARIMLLNGVLVHTFCPGRAAYHRAKEAERAAVLAGGLVACARCGIDKPLADYPKGRNRRDGQNRYRYCKPCHSSYQRGVSLKRNYNITPDDYRRLEEHQGGVCAICRTPPRGRRLNVDHDHKTGLVRGLLCFVCNQVVGMFRDDLERMRAFCAYFEKPPAPVALGEERFGVRGRVYGSANYKSIAPSVRT